MVKTEDEKQQKEILIKRLTQAWEKRDYLELLLLKETIDVEHSIPVEFSGKNIKSITDQLNKKIMPHHPAPIYYHFCYSDS